MRSFRNLWFWIALAVMWSAASHYVLGVPWDMVTRARRGRAGALEDINTLAAINARRILCIRHESGVMLTGIAFFLLSGALMLGWVYGHEFAQAVFLLMLPMALVWLLSLRTATRIAGEGLRCEALIDRLTRHRLFVQLIGMASIFITALWGMYRNMTTSVFGG